MKGTVEIFNAVKGIGFLKDESGERRFFHQSDLRVPPGFRAIAVGKSVEFTISTHDGRSVAKGINPINGTGVQVAHPLPKAIMLDRGVAVLRVDTLNRIYAKENLFPFGEFVIAPGVWVEGAFRAFRADDKIQELTLCLPLPTRERVFLALNQDKALLPFSEKKLLLDPGSYILFLEGNGDLDVQSIGRRYQPEKGGGNWVVLEHRLRQTLDLQKEIEGQLSTSGLARDNDGFIPAIEEAITFLKQGVTVS